jgi:proto-oncogene tyrosine-protein kinase ROS
MAQFRHPHIIQLMGICVDKDPCYLLLELMGEGDLLSYLRSNRPSHGGRQQQQQHDPQQIQQQPHPLNLTDLLRMCVDVAKGCVYLEDLHFVHRDIAARNCLVSFILVKDQEDNVERERRVVKIGDFGLARDIYRNDYYRKDGEGLLPGKIFINMFR